ncbi:MAG: thioredoxin domain-containing protein [Bacteriovoracaceae bacterium]|nr:thioredoxin domain-containing protein [Bacteriovoracaceae bacterium]
MDKKGLTLQGMTSQHAVHILVAILMIGTGVYLTSHYYSTLYPTTLGGSSTLCDVSAFWNCDVATHSPVAAIAGVPIAFFGLLNGIMLLAASIFPNPAMEKTCSAVSKYNAMGTIALLGYSLVALGGLCPVCSLYYVLSWISCFLFIRYGLNEWMPDLKVTAIAAVITIAGGAGFNQYTSTRATKQLTITTQVIDQYKKLADYGDPENASPYRVHSSTENFQDAPIRVSVFSDFQCPFCKMVAEQMPQLARRYEGKINIQYFFYPLDSACNPNVKSAMHEFACSAAMLAACNTKNFASIHDEIFAAQEKLNFETLKAIAEKNGLSECFTKQSTRDAVLTSMNAATKFNLRSTPTIIINGKKIEGSIPNPQFFAIFDEILKK